ncbi:protein virilizer homolog isoform X3 [Curcuma longa]|uniref:protein virilizer homolog isoform X3 n=1 Tax=Curcuma longa TaxID=136217 RepID=UPI003D9EBD3D
MKKAQDMGRSEPCILFAQSFVHSQLDEYVDEVIFSEPVVITACEFLEQNASPSAPNVSLVGATSPPSFALEIFVHCEGESRFRRLCQPFLYSHSSSNVLEVEAIVTNHLVVRGSYRSLTLIVYGNTAEDLGQFNIGFDMDNSLANVVCSPSEGKLEDLPPALHSNKLLFVEPMSSLKFMSLPDTKFEVSPHLKQFLLLSVKLSKVPDVENQLSEIVGNVVSAVLSCVRSMSSTSTFYWDQNMELGITDFNRDADKLNDAVPQASKELLELGRSKGVFADNWSPDDIAGSETAEALISDLLISMFNKFDTFKSTLNAELQLVSQCFYFQNKQMILLLGLALLFCCWRKGCFHFVNSGGMETIVRLLDCKMQNSPAVVLMLLGVVECATRHGIGCEGFLGWWPRGNESYPDGNSNGYSILLRLLLRKQRHDVASLASYILHRLRVYEVAARYESVVLSLLDNPSRDHVMVAEGIELLVAASSHLKQIAKLINLYEPIEDPSPVTFAQKLSILGLPEGFLSYKATIDCITTSKYTFARWDVDLCLLSLLEERGFFPLSAALLSSPVLRSSNDKQSDIFVEIATSVEYALLNFLFHRSGLCFLLAHREATELLVLSLQDVEETTKKECMTLRQAAIFLSKGFICHPQEVAMITELHLKVGIAIDLLLATDPHSDELLWILWELCAISRSDSGRQALLVLCHFPEVVSVLLDTLRSYTELEPTVKRNGASPLSLAIFHSAAEIFEIIVTDSSASSLSSWIGHAVELHKALHFSSPGTNRKDAPTRLLEWIDAGVVYHRNGAIGLLRYAAVLASGGDAHLSSSSVLVSDTIDVENVIGDLANNSDAQIVDNLLGKLVSDKYFDGVTLCNSSIVQLTTTFRILAFISDDPVVAASLFEEGAVTLVYVVLVNCKSMVERLSNSYDYLVDDGAEYNTTTDILLDRSHDQSLIDLMIPSLLLLINLLKKLQDAKDEYRNKKLMNALLQLHREVSLKLAACAADLSFPYPSSTVGFSTVCHLLTSSLACWPVFGWTPDLFHCILESVQATSSLALGPKDACSIFCLLGDLFPDEDIWLWKNEMPPLSALRTLSIGTLLGPQAEKDINWYLHPEHTSVLLMQLTPQLDRVGQIVLHFAFSALLVIQDMLRVFIIRIACQKEECAVVLLRPIFSWLDSHIDETSSSEMDTFKVYQLLHFISSLLEHPHAKLLLLKMQALRIMGKVLLRCSNISKTEGKLSLEIRVPSKNISMLTWSFPVFKSVFLVFTSQSPVKQSPSLETEVDSIMNEESCFIVHQILVLLQVLPVGRELLSCLLTFMAIVSCCQGRSALASVVFDKQKCDEGTIDGNMYVANDWRSPFLSFLKKLAQSLDAKEGSEAVVVDILCSLSLSASHLTVQDDKLDGILILKCLFGLSSDVNHAEDEKLKNVCDTIENLEQRIIHDEDIALLVGKATLLQAKDSLKSMLSLLQGPSSSFGSVSEMSRSDETVLPLSNIWMLNQDVKEISNEFATGEFAEKFMWDCADSSLDRQLTPTLSSRRKLALADGPNKRARESLGSEAVGSSVLSRGLSIASASSAPMRRDTFRHRKPNTSRPPSMHVDDYVARERNIDGASNGPNTGSSVRGISISGRPPSIHVDEFMARQKERQNPMNTAVGDSSQFKNLMHANSSYSGKPDKPQPMKTDLDDDLQGINIVFDEESESDEQLPFPQPDESLCPPVVIGESSPSLVAAEIEGDADETTRHSVEPPSSIRDGSLRAGNPLGKLASMSEVPASQEVNASSENFTGMAGENSSCEQSEESKYVSPNDGSRVSIHHPLSKTMGFSPHTQNLSPAASSVLPLPSSTRHQSNSPQRGADGSISSGSHDKSRILMNQPPLPPMPPPAAVSAHILEPVGSHILPFSSSARDVQPPIPSGYPPRFFDPQSDNAPSTSSSSFANAQPGIDSKLHWNMTSSSRFRSDSFTSTTSVQPVPPLPPVPPPFSASVNHSSKIFSGSQAPVSNPLTNAGAQTHIASNNLNSTNYGALSVSGNSFTSYSLPMFTSPLFIGRPASVSGTFFSSSSMQNIQNTSSLSQHFTGSQFALQSVLPRPPPPQPQPRPAQQLALPNQLLQTQSDQAMQLQQNPVQVQVNQLQIPQQIQVPRVQLYYQTQQQESVLQPGQSALEQVQQPAQNLQADNSQFQQKDSGMTLQQYFSSPEAIQSLLSDRDKLCQLLEQHPKLMQMLQERLGQQ